MADSTAQEGARLLYLVQHGEAVPKSEDAERPLSALGWASAERVAAWMAAAGLGVDQVRHSGKLRARQTATIFSQRLQPRQGIASYPGLGPHDDVQPVADALEKCPCSVMLVGHLPFLGRLAGLLLVGDPERPLIQFPNAGLVGLAREEDRWTLTCAVPPELLPKAT